MKEIWKDIKGYEGMYQISSFGRVKSLERVVEYLYNGNKKTKRIKEQILKPQQIKKGYLVVGLSKNNKHTHALISRLVAEAFIPNPENKPQVDHINTDVTDNRVENLRWCTQQENTDNPISKAKHRDYYSKHVGNKHHCAKRYIQLTKEGELIRVWDSAVDAHNAIGVNPTHIGACCTGKRKTAGGSKWKYYDTDTYLIALMVKNLKAKGIILRNAS